MKIKNILFGFCMIALGNTMLSCSDYINNDELDDHIYLLQSGLTNANVYNWGVYTYKLPVIKSGKGNNVAVAKLTIDEEVLNKYNSENGTSYKIMPADCYITKDMQINFSKSSYREFFTIDFNPEVLSRLEEKNTEKIKYVLPCKLELMENNINLSDSTKDRIIIYPQVSQPYIGFEVPYYYSTGTDFSIKTDEDDIQMILPKIGVNFPNDWDISYEVEVNETILDEYNDKNGTSLKMIPSTAYEIDKNSCVVRKNFISEYLKIKLNEEAFKTEGENYIFGKYAIPLKITTVSKFNIDPEAFYTIYPVNIIAPNVNRSAWKVDTVSTEITDEIEHSSSLEKASNLFDGKPNTVWKTKWEKPDMLPYFVSINLGEKDKLYGLSFTLPSDVSIGNVKSGYFEVSPDNENWAKVVSFSRSNENEDREMEFDIKMVESQYIRFVITDAFEYADPTIGKASGARCALAEIMAKGY